MGFACAGDSAGKLVYDGNDENDALTEDLGVGLTQYGQLAVPRLDGPPFGGGLCSMEKLSHWLGDARKRKPRHLEIPDRLTRPILIFKITYLENLPKWILCRRLLPRHRLLRPVRILLCLGQRGNVHHFE